MNRAITFLMMVSLIVPPGLSVNKANVDAYVESCQASQAEAQPGQTAILPPEDCNVPLKGPFGPDEEVFRGGGDNPGVGTEEGGFGYEYAPAWGGLVPVANSIPQGPVAAARIDSAQYVALWQPAGGALRASIWDGKWEPPVTLPPISGTLMGSPAVVGPGNGSVDVFVRNDLGQLYTWSSDSTAWIPLSQTLSVSDPAAVATDPDHLLVFYRGKDGNIYFTERQGSVWRDTSLALLKQAQQLLFLPVISTRQNQFSTSLELMDANDTSSVMIQPSELSAASRNSNHAAVFFVDVDNHLWVIEWTNKNKSDWSDARWTRLMANVKIEKPAVASRHVNHLAVVVRNVNGDEYIVEWTPNANGTGSPGWGIPQPLNSPAETVTVVGPLAMASTMTNKLSVFSSDSAGLIYQKEWLTDGSWGDWTGMGTNLRTGNQTIAAVSGHPDDLMLVFAAANGTQVGSRHYSSVASPPAKEQVSSTKVVSDVPSAAAPRGQALVWVDKKTLWVTSAGIANGDWYVKASVVGEDILAGQLTLSNQVYQLPAVPYMEAADLDRDGDEEVIFATIFKDMISQQYRISLSAIDFSFTDGPILSLLASYQVTTGIGTNEDVVHPGLSFSMALGDLDQDGVDNELVIAYTLPRVAISPVIFQVLQYTAAGLTGNITLKREASFPKEVYTPDGYLYYNDYVQVTIAQNLHQGSGPQIVIGQIKNVYSYIPIPTFYLLYAYPSLRAFQVLTGNEWYIDASTDELLIASVWGLPNIMYPLGTGSQNGRSFWHLNQCVADYPFLLNSPMAIADLDADGYDEIAYAYVDRLMVVDPTPKGEPPAGVPGPGNNNGYMQWTQFDDSATGFDDPNLCNVGLMNSLAAGDIDKDGREEIIGENFIYKSYYTDIIFPDYVPKLTLFEVQGDNILAKTRQEPLKSRNQNGRLNAILMGDLDGDSFTSELTGCSQVTDYKVVAVLNGAPRWYSNGVPINESRGYYIRKTYESEAYENSVKQVIGGSVTIGYKESFAIPVIGIEAGEVRASLTEEVMKSSGVKTGRVEYQANTSGLGFEGMASGVVVYESVSRSCYYYDIALPSSPQDISKGMICTPSARNSTTGKKSLLDWRDQKNTIGPSWADVGHQSPGGVYSNDLSIPGNYKAYLPVDPFMLLYTFPALDVQRSQETTFSEFTWEKGVGGSRSKIEGLDVNITASAGGTVMGASLDVSVTTGVGFETSETMSWDENLAFYGRIFDFSGDHRCYKVVPYVYQATAKTLAGVTYPYFEMDYYVTDIYTCP